MKLIAADVRVKVELHVEKLSTPVIRYNVLLEVNALRENVCVLLTKMRVSPMGLLSVFPDIPTPIVAGVVMFALPVLIAYLPRMEQTVLDVQLVLDQTCMRQL